ncbi:hypothetical protein R6Q59_016265 [Mikania micrantha]
MKLGEEPTEPFYYLQLAPPSRDVKLERDHKFDTWVSHLCGFCESALQRRPCSCCCCALHWKADAAVAILSCAHSHKNLMEDASV